MLPAISPQQGSRLSHKAGHAVNHEGVLHTHTHTHTRFAGGSYRAQLVLVKVFATPTSSEVLL